MSTELSSTNSNRNDRRQGHQDVHDHEWQAQEIGRVTLMLSLAPSLAGADISGRDLSWAALRHKSMAGMRARRCCCFRANLEGCDLTGAELQDADLTNCFMDGACLTGAWLDGATARDVRLRDARLDSARLFGVDLSGARLDGASLDGALYDALTVWPAGFDPAAAGARLKSVDATYRRLPRETPMCSARHSAEQAWVEHLRGIATAGPQARVRRHRPSVADLLAAGIEPDPGRLYS